MTASVNEYDELRFQIEQLRSLLETLVVRGLRACGPDELARLNGFADHLAQSGAGHLAPRLTDLRSQIERDDRTSAQTLLEAQTNVRLLERLLTLRVVSWRYASALKAMQYAGNAAEVDIDPDADEE